MSDTRKVVINKCFGGFSLSAEAERRLIGCPHMKLMEPREYYGGRDGWEQDFERDKKRGEGLLGVVLHGGKVVIDEHDSAPGGRECPQLVAIVEAMGEAADGRCARLGIVEIPADVKYEISEYDGSEHVAETHRTWY